LVVLVTWTPAGLAGARILSPSEVLETSTVQLGGELHLVVGEGPTVRLITDPGDPEITNRGDGSFHPAPLDVVEEAVAFAEERFTDALDFQVMILPYPRSGRLRSTTERGVIYLSPGVQPYTREQIHFLVSHEIGHVLHQQLLPDTDATGWSSYREVRGILDESVFHDHAAHADRPHEIFAEDFRQLYGGPLGSRFPQENTDLERAAYIPGLPVLFASLLPDPVMTASTSPLVLGPNPFRPGQRLAFRWPGAGVHRLEIVDVSGRIRVRKTFATAKGDGFTWLWDGRDDGGLRLPAGTYFVKLTGDGNGAVGRVVIVD
jgi:hypothetical protein